MYMGTDILEELTVSIFRVEVKDETIQSSTMYNYLSDFFHISAVHLDIIKVLFSY